MYFNQVWSGFAILSSGSDTDNLMAVETSLSKVAILDMWDASYSKLMKVKVWCAEFL